MSSPGTQRTSDYVVALRGPSAALLPRDEPLLVKGKTASGLVQLTVNTRLVNSGFADSVPRGLWVDAQGKADSVNAALTEFANIANFVCSFVALATNAWVGELQPELGYDASPGLKRRDYFQQSLPEGPATFQLARQGNPGAILALMNAVNSHADSELFQRAVVQYGMALEHWRPGHEVFAVAHLWMGMEALTPVIRHQVCRNLRIPKERWRKSWQGVVEADETLKDNGIRRDVLFQGDAETYSNAKEAMDGYEHGYMAFAAVRSQAVAARDASALYLRTAIMMLSGLNKDKRDVLFGPEFIEPFDAVPISKYLRGVLISDTDELASKNQAYPILHWSTKLVALSRTSEGRYKASFKERHRAELGEGVLFEARSFEIWGPKDAKRGQKAGPGAVFEFEVERNLSDVPLTARDHVKDVLDVAKGANVSPSFTSEKLKAGTFEDRLDVFEDQVRGWWLSKAYALDPADDNSAYVVLPIAAAVMIALERFRAAKPYARKRPLFRDAFLKLFPNAPGSTGYSRRELRHLPDRILDWIEGGVTSQGNVLINERGPLPVRVVGATTDRGSLEIIEINPKRFLDNVTGAFQTYVRNLRDPSTPGGGELRKRFEQTYRTLADGDADPATIVALLTRLIRKLLASV